MDRFKEYKLVADFNEWSKNNDPDKLYCITTEDGEELFDVYEEDFISMIDNNIVNSEGNYYLLNNPSEEQIEQYAKQYGIHWIDKYGHKAAIEGVRRATAALYHSISEHIKELTKDGKELTIMTSSDVCGTTIEETWLVVNENDNITIISEFEMEYMLDEMTIQTLIDLNDALMNGNYW